ncbi:hypothetical protein [Chondrinema litorale]|uniref:hypothetical protein n=1 Tax=Chondrinema litorale TaxID=2994555 RepID=UPI002543D1FF|nr:hypothetical protein [Chondrinema litorale]UZR95664.1 hypothetical protein OQ292_07555 [Chondrinema litorale]
MRFLLFILFTLSSFFLVEEDYHKIFGDDYDDALEYVEKNKVNFFNIFEQDSTATKVAIAIVFPELIRYSMVRDFFETTMLEILYTQYGSNTVDFSIGSFQMKPSFIEALENYALINNDHVYKEIGFDKTLSEEDRRKVRLKRLKDEQWQIQYLKTFITLYSGKEQLYKTDLIENRVVFLSRAYNQGLESSTSQLNIEEFLNSNAYFPYGKKYLGKQYNYVAIALDFFTKYQL